MNRTFIYTINKNKYNQTIETFLRELGYSRHILAHLKRTTEGVMINERWERLNYLMQTGDVLTILYIEEHASENIVASTIPISIIYEDQDLLILNKPANLPVHPSQGNFDNTLANALAHYYESSGQTFVFRCINRLDRDTTGLILIAKNGISGCILSTMMKNRQIKRTYAALAEGFTAPTGTITAPIARMEGSTIARCINFSGGEYASTHYRTLARKNGYSLISLQLETGRTHQIRVHMNYIGHPLPGDFLYHTDYRIINRQALHSHELSFLHPITGKDMHFQAELPKDFPIKFNE